MCGIRGHAVPGQTVKALLAVSLRQLHTQTYWFCSAPNCPIVYFSSETPDRFTIADVREVVYQKALQDPTTPICYCFRHTVGDVSSNQSENLQAIIQDITQGIRDDQCACDLRNPQGSCCLGNVRRYLQKSAKPLDE